MPSRAQLTNAPHQVLRYHLENICKAIYASAANCPAMLRTMLTDVRKLATSKFPKDKTVRYTAVSAFIFLRLFCPAIINPKLFNMMPDYPSETTARNLTLVAKSLQNLANMSEFGVKEAYMVAVNGTLMALRGGMTEYLDAISVGGVGWVLGCHSNLSIFPAPGDGRRQGRADD